jgi:hypothetical protein
MIGNQLNRVNRIVLIVLSFLLVMSISTCAAGQVEDLTDRELLIQLIEKFNHFRDAIERIEINSSAITGEIISFDKRIDKNSIEIDNLSEGHKATISRWNILLGFFVTFILGIFIWMWKRSYK